MDVGHNKRMDDLISRQYELNLKLFNAETENEGMKSVIERLESDLYSLTEKLKNANAEIDRLAMVKPRNQVSLVASKNLVFNTK